MKERRGLEEWDKGRDGRAADPFDAWLRLLISLVLRPLVDLFRAASRFASSGRPTRRRGTRRRRRWNRGPRRR